MQDLPTLAKPERTWHAALQPAASVFVPSPL
jgi:hypothetical protein